MKENFWMWFFTNVHIYDALQAELEYNKFLKKNKFECYNKKIWLIEFPEKAISDSRIVYHALTQKKQTEYCNAWQAYVREQVKHYSNLVFVI